MKLKLSQNQIRKLTPGSKRMDHFDTEESGLILRVETSGKKTWLISQRVPGTDKRIYYTIGPWGEKAIQQSRPDTRLK